MNQNETVSSLQEENLCRFPKVVLFVKISGTKQA